MSISLKVRQLLYNSLKARQILYVSLKVRQLLYISLTVKQLLYTLRLLCISLKKRKHSFTSYPAEKHPKCSKFAITDMRQKPLHFFCCTIRASALTPEIILLTQVPFAKVSVPVQFIIPRLDSCAALK